MRCLQRSFRYLSIFCFCLWPCGAFHILQQQQHCCRPTRSLESSKNVAALLVPAKAKHIPISRRFHCRAEITKTSLFLEENVSDYPGGNDVSRPSVTAPTTSFPWVASVALATSLLFGSIPTGTSPSIAQAYDQDDYMSDAVATVLTQLKDAQSASDIYTAYENVANIIVEGKGVGGAVNFQGVQLNRGFIADEDTSIYNPGLTLLTENEKERLVAAVVQTKKQNVNNNNNWNNDNQLAYEFLKDKLDPFHVTELRPYLSVAPIWIGVVYAAVLSIRQFFLSTPAARNFWFPVTYFMGVAAIVAPGLILIASGP
jgi:hypothetical protein